MKLDRTKAGARAFILAQLPRRLYLAEYSGVVIAQHGPNSFDFHPDDPRIPGVSGVPLRLPAPGFTITVNPAFQPRAKLAWADGDPSKPELRLWEAPGLDQLAIAPATLLTLDAAQVKLGAAATDAVLKGGTFISAFNAWRAALNAYLSAIATLNPAAIATAAAAYAVAESTFEAVLMNVLSVKAKVE